MNVRKCHSRWPEIKTGSFLDKFNFRKKTFNHSMNTKNPVFISKMFFMFNNNVY